MVGSNLQHAGAAYGSDAGAHRDIFGGIPGTSGGTEVSVNPRVLLVDDERPFVKALGISLKAHGYLVDLASDGDVAIALAASRHPDLVILDLGLPRTDGSDVLRAIRGWSKVPVLVLSARDSETDKVAALDIGADDYVTKPFAINELLARMRAVLRRAAARDLVPGKVVTEDFTVDLAAREVRDRSGGHIRLTPIQWAIVDLLVRNSGCLVSQRQILKEVWGPAYEKETNYLRVFMTQVRRRLEPDPARPRYFHTEPGIGYRFVSHNQPKSGG
ncbi:MAG: response regulator [Actinobacteria bacterium]|nr:response regulator [Actinomycetota bacterium]